MGSAARRVFAWLLLSAGAAAVAATASSSHWSAHGGQQDGPLLEERIAARQSPMDDLRDDLLLDSEDPAEQHMTINAIEIVDGAVTASKIADGAVTALKIADGEVKTADLADASNDASAPTGIVTSKIENGSITTGKLANLAVTSAKLAGSDADNALLGIDRAVTATALGDGAVTTRALFPGSVTDDKLDQGSDGVLARVSDLRVDFDGLKIDDGTSPNDGSNLVHWNNLDGVPSDIIATKATDLDCNDGSGCVDSTDLEADAVTDDKIMSVGAAKVTTGTLNPARIPVITGGMVTTIDADGLTGANIADGAIGAHDLAPGVLRGAHSVSGTAVVANAPTGNIALGTITGEAAPGDGAPTGNIALKTIAASNLADGAVTADKLTANAVYSGTSGLVSTMTNDGAPNVVATADITIPGSGGSHVVLVNGQTVLSCSGGTCSGSLTWELVNDGGSPVGLARSIKLGGPGDLPIFVSGLDVGVPSGSTGFTYSLVVTYSSVDGSDTLTASTSDITVVDLGRS